MIGKTIATAAAGMAVLTATLAAPSAASASGTKQVHLRKGLTLTIPASWKAVQAGTDWTRVITGSCPSLGTMDFGFRDAGCHGFWVLGPKALKIGNHTFQSYNPRYGFEPATDVSVCPRTVRLYKGTMKLAGKGLRKVGAGHRADYHVWAGTCVDKKFRVKMRYSQREWYLPSSKILIVDQWNTPGLDGILRRATWN
ncbi:hypothetical protein [Microbispora triticiradicis]|uniref:hypothetical protein n=1 Tax=Microbispora triticiradicis TaxID=2200763 RepID=UPI001AD79C30|nr:hypothetical protein [Microbispora triticiradicis]MBO4269527.1 hypothetical protein [Microbispora triticiradicis]